MTIPVSSTAAQARTRAQGEMAATVQTATRSAASDGSGSVTSHCVNATAAITAKTGTGERRRSTSGNARAAENNSSVFGRSSWNTHQEETAKIAVASTRST